MSQKRIEAWDFLKSFAIFLVVWGHCLRYMVNGNPYEITIYAWMKTFHMPLFIVLAGLFAVKGFKRESVKEFLIKRGHRLLLPALTWGILIYIIDLWMLDYNSIGLFINDVFYGSLWFLKCLFICGILGLIAFRPIYHRKAWLLFSLVISQFIPYWNICVMYPCFVSGMLITHYLDILIKFKKITLWISGLLFISISTIIVLNPSFWITTSGIKNALLRGEIFSLEYLPIVSGILLRNYGQMISGISGSLFLIIGSYVLTENIKMPKIFHDISKMGKYTMGVYLFQTIVIEMFLANVISIEKESSTLFVYIVSPIMALITVWLTINITKYICERYINISAILFGENIPKSNIKNSSNETDILHTFSSQSRGDGASTTK